MRCCSVIPDAGNAAPEMLFIPRLLKSTAPEPAKIDSSTVEDCSAK